MNVTGLVNLYIYEYMVLAWGMMLFSKEECPLIERM